ncbi:MAG: hypothetical protein AAGF99_06630 [Bacteroidota bacterium]
MDQHAPTSAHPSSTAIKRFPMLVADLDRLPATGILLGVTFGQDPSVLGL